LNPYAQGFMGESLEGTWGQLVINEEDPIDTPPAFITQKPGD